MKKTIKVTLIVIAIIMLAATLVGISYKLTNGFKDWNLINKPGTDVPPVSESKEIVSTTIFNEKYGTFVIPKDSMAVSMFTPILYRNGTDLSIIKNEFADSYSSLDTNFNIDDYDICLHVINNNSTSLKYNEKKTSYPNLQLYLFNNNIVEYTNHEFEQEAERIYIIPKTDNAAVIPIFQKIYVTSLTTEINYMPAEITISINSDKGYPLTELMYKEMVADETTIITYNYA